MEASFWNGKRASGIADDIDMTQYDSVVAVIEESLKKYADRPAFTSIGHTLSYREIDQYSAAFAAYLQNKTNLKPGDRIAIQMPNVLQFPIVMYGALRAGLVVVNTNPLYTEREMLHQFNDAQATAVVCIDIFAKAVENILPQTNIKTVIVTSLADMLPWFKRTLINAATKYIKKMVPAYHLPNAVRFLDALNQGKTLGSFVANHPKGLNETIILQYTGGTTGVAKGAELTNGNLIANMLQVDECFNQADSTGKRIKPTESCPIIAPLPLYHIFAFTVHLMVMVRQGDHNILIANPRDTGMFIRMMKPHQMVGIVGLNTLFVSLINHPKFKELDFSKLMVTCSGGTALQQETAKRWEKITGCAISEGYGLTETSPVVCLNPIADGLQRLGSVGPAVPGTALKCIDDDGNDVGLNERGELCVKGPQVMKGYWNAPDESKGAFTEDGWLRTGDVAIIDDDGFVSIVDRIKDMIIVSGFNVYPNEVEDVVVQHPKVAMAAAIGVQHEKSGEAVKLFIVKSDESLTKEEIIRFCKKRLTAYKVPRNIEFRTELPMTPVGKILRRELKEENRE